MIKQLIENAFKCWKDEDDSKNDKLTLASKQSLLALVKDEINHSQRYSQLLSITSKQLYDFADKNDSDTLDYFNKLNKNRNENRKVKKRIKQLARIAKELKMSMQ